MKHIFLLSIGTVYALANISTINSFEADFTQDIIDSKGKTIKYTGHVMAKKPQYAYWKYKSPVEKSVYILPQRVVIVEPELEQAIVKFIRSDFDFFSLLKSAKKVNKDTYAATYNNSTFKIKMHGSEIVSIFYKDEFENDVEIHFAKQKQNIKIDDMRFVPEIPSDYDVIRD